MSTKKGSITVQTEDIFPIIKKWLYSEHDIFLRELVANATDAITKRSVLARTRNQEIPEGKISVVVSKKNKTITISDNGIGMTENEVEKYIAQLAFSGAREFVEQLKASGNETKTDIIGKFGLGFFSSFMVSDMVEVDTLSMNEGAVPTKWSCKGETEYIFSKSERTEVGTSIILHINSESEEFLDTFKVSSTLRNFCDFMPYPIEVLDLDRFEERLEEIAKQKDKEDNKLEPIKAQLINDTLPLWKKDPTTLKDEDYTDFFHKLFPMDPAPLFWLHLKVDHPFTLEGILYFPKINPNRPFNESNIRLYCKQVFVSDNVKNIIPDFLSLLKGAIDSSDIPLNVSRSSLQGDPNVKKISNYVVRKVAESLKKLFNNDRKKYEQIWEDIGLFVKYGCISDPKFDELMREMVIFKNAENNYCTLKEYQDSIPSDFAEKLKDKIIYCEKGKSDLTLRKQLWANKIHSIETDDHIDPHFLQHVEFKPLNDSKYKFSSIDGQIESILECETTSADDLKIKDLFKKYLTPNTDSKESSVSSALDIDLAKLKGVSVPAYIKVDESMKRFKNMAKSMGQTDSFPLKKTLVVNPNNKLIQNTFELSKDENNGALVEKICAYVLDLASISSDGLKAEDKELFVQRGQDLLEELTKNRIK